MSRNTSFNSLINKLSALHKKSADTTSSLLKENKQLREEVNELRTFKKNVLHLLQFATDPTTLSRTIPTTSITTSTSTTTPTIPVVKEESAPRQEVGSDSENDPDYVPSHEASSSESSSESEWDEEKEVDIQPTRITLQTVRERALNIGLISERTKESSRNRRLLIKAGQVISKDFKRNLNSTPPTKPEYFKYADKTFNVKAYPSNMWSKVDEHLKNVFAEA